MALVLWSVSTIQMHQISFSDIGVGELYAPDLLYIHTFIMYVSLKMAFQYA